MNTTLRDATRNPAQAKLLPRLFPVTRQIFKPLWFEDTDRLHVAMNKNGDYFVVTVTTTDGGYPSSAARQGWLMTIPARKQNTHIIGIQWSLEATDCSAIAIAVYWNPDQITWEPDARLTFEYVLTTVLAQERSVRLVARYKEHVENCEALRRVAAVTPQLFANGTSPPQTPEELALALYQQVAATCGVSSEGYALFMEQGTGKTPTAIAIMCEDAKRLRETESRLYRTLIVCPKNVRMNWQSELRRFSTVPGHVTVLRGGSINRTRQVIEAMVPRNQEQYYSAIVCNYETLVNSLELFIMLKWDLALLDESHFIKSPYTQRAKAALKLRDSANRRMVLTGTPVTNTPLDLWSQLEFLGRGFSGFQTWKSFKEFYGVFHVDGEGFRRLISVQNLPFMQERLARCSFVIRKEEALPGLPDKVYDVIEVEMTERQLEIYRSVRDKLLAEIEDEMNRENDRQLLVSNVLTKLLRLAQITSGFVSWDPVVDPDTGEVYRERLVEAFTPNPKLDALIEVLKDPEKTENEKTLIWACWVYDIKTISARLTEEGIEHVTYYGGTKDAQRVENEHRYNCDPRCRVFVGNPTSGGTGLNLLGYPPGSPEGYTTNTTQEIYYSQNWSSTARSQSEDRGHRRGTRVRVRITDLAVPNTIDEEIRTRVTDKRSAALEITDLRDLLNRCLGGD